MRTPVHGHINVQPAGAHAMQGTSDGCQDWECRFLTHGEGSFTPLRHCADPFVDDIIVGSGTEDMTDDAVIQVHQKHLRPLVGPLDRHSMVCKPQGCLTLCDTTGVRWTCGWRWAALTHTRETCSPTLLGKSPRLSVNSSPQWYFATILRDMYECMRISRGLSKTC